MGGAGVMPAMVYAALRFLFEMLCLVIVGVWGFGLARLGHLRYVVGVVAPLAVVLVWGFWGSPRAPWRLQGGARLLLELGIYAVSAVCLYHTGLRRFTPGFVVLGVASAGIHHLLSLQI